MGTGWVRQYQNTGNYKFPSPCHCIYNYKTKQYFCQRPDVINSQTLAINILLHGTYEVMPLIVSSCLRLNLEKSV